MTEESGRAVERAIGKLEGTLGALVDQVKDNAEKSEAGRARIYLELEAARIEMSSIRNEMKAQQATIERSATTINNHATTLGEIERWRERFVGMMMLGSLISGALITGAIAGLKWLAVKLGLN